MVTAKWIADSAIDEQRMRGLVIELTGSAGTMDLQRESYDAILALAIERGDVVKREIASCAPDYCAESQKARLERDEIKERLGSHIGALIKERSEVEKQRDELARENTDLTVKLAGARNWLDFWERKNKKQEPELTERQRLLRLIEVFTLELANVER